MSLVRPVSVSFGEAGGRLHYGIGSADILIEVPTEDGMTHLSGIIQNYRDLDGIGGIGAARPSLLSAAVAFGAVSLHNGIGGGQATARPDALDYQDGSLASVFYTNGGALFTSGTRLLGALENYEKGGARTPFRFADTPVTPSGGLASGVVIPYSDTSVVQFVYDREAGVYQRRQNSLPHTDAGTGQALAYENVFLLVCESSIHHKVTGTELDVHPENGGRGYYLTNGRYEEIRFAADSDGRLCFYDAQGNLLTVNAGKSYIGMIDLQNAASLLIVE